MPHRLRRLAQHYPLCAACLALALLLIGGSVPLQFNLRRLEAKHHRRATLGENMLRFVARGAQLRTELAVARAATRRIDDHLIDEKNVPENYGFFLKLVQDTKVTLIDLKPRAAPLSDTGVPPSYKRVPFSLKISGSLPAIITCLRELETGPRLARINAFQAQRVDPAAGTIALTLEVELLAQP